eukprot:gene1487-32872_t
MAKPPRLGPSAPPDPCECGAPPFQGPIPPRIPVIAEPPRLGTQLLPRNHCMALPPFEGPSAPQDPCDGGAPPSRDPAPPRIPVMAEPPLLGTQRPPGPLSPPLLGPAPPHETPEECHPLVSNDIPRSAFASVILGFRGKEYQYLMFNAGRSKTLHVICAAAAIFGAIFHHSMIK